MTWKRGSRKCLALVLFAMAAACSSEQAADTHKDAPSTPGTVGEPAFTIGAVHYTVTCSETYLDECNSLCDDCWNACANVSGDFDCIGICRSICDCSDASSKTCASWSASFDLGKADPQNEAACEDLSKQMSTACDLHTRDGLCHAFAGAERHEAAAMYTCAADNIIGGDCETYFDGCTFPPDQLGTTLCTQFAADCDETCPLTTAEVDDDAGWLRDDVRAAGNACLGLSGCYRKEQCLEAWQRAAFPAIGR